MDYSATDMERQIEMLIENPTLREERARDLIRIRPHHTWRERAKIFHEALMSL